MKVYKLAVEYPTPDGRPFIEQPVEAYEAAVSAELDPLAKPAPVVPEWLQQINIDGWIWGEPDPWNGETGASEYAAVTVYTEERRPLIDVPHAKRKHFFRRAIAEQQAERLRSWKCKVTILESQEIEWTAVGV